MSDTETTNLTEEDIAKLSEEDILAMSQEEVLSMFDVLSDKEYANFVGAAITENLSGVCERFGRIDTLLGHRPLDGVKDKLDALGEAIDALLKVTAEVNGIDWTTVAGLGIDRWGV